MKNFSRTPQQEIELIESGNIEKNMAAIKVWAYTPKAQCHMMKPGHETVRDLYIEMRRPCAQFVAKAISSKDRDLVKRAVVGGTLSKDNEAAFVRMFADDLQTIEKYLKECPDGPYLLDSTMKVAAELGIAEKLKRMVYDIAKQRHATTNIGELLKAALVS